VGHRQIEHTADLALEIWAPTEEELLLEGARAIVEILTEQAEIGAEAVRELHLDAIDPPDRLVVWLNEVLVLAVSEGFLVHDGELSLREDGLDARVRGLEDAGALVRTELKSATYHDLELTRGQDGFRARVVIDV